MTVFSERKNRRIYDRLTPFLDEEKTSATFPGQFILRIGRFFLGTPYGNGTLETEGTEGLVVNLGKLDCFTFVENVVALALVSKSRKKSLEAFCELLRKIRYRQGRLQGYASRLHYFSDWIHDNEKKGIIKDVTAEIGGRPWRKTINFMTTHQDLYPALKDAANLRKMRSVEKAINGRSHFFIPKRSLRRFEDRIRDGDLIAITTDREGLDVQHVGIAARVKNRIHLLHASSKEGRVVLSKKTLYRYLMQSKVRSGIIVVRILAKGVEQRS
jgi:hypothetical protein